MLDLVLSATLLALSSVSLLWFLVLRGVARFAPKAKAGGGSVLMSASIVEYYYFVVAPVVRFLVTLGVTGNQVTAFSLVLGIGGGVAAALGHFGVAGLLLIVSSVCDGIDGEVARAQGKSSVSGAIFDAAVDRYNEIAILAGIAFFVRNNTPLLVVTMLALTGALMVSYSSAKAESLHVPAPRGAMRRGERAMYLCTGVTLVPLAGALAHAPVSPATWAMTPLAIGLGLIASLGNLSAISRFRAVARAVEEREASLSPAAPPALEAPPARASTAPASARFALFRHQIAALLATSVDFVTMVALVELFALTPSHATLVGASAGAGANFVLGRKYTFPDSQGSVLGQLVRYGVVAGMSALLNAFGVWALGRVGIPYGGARVVTALVVSVAWNFPMHRAFVFAAPEATGEQDEAHVGGRRQLDDAHVRP